MGQDTALEIPAKLMLDEARKAVAGGLVGAREQRLEIFAHDPVEDRGFRLPPVIAARRGRVHVASRVTQGGPDPLNLFSTPYRPSPCRLRRNSCRRDGSGQEGTELRARS